MRDPDAEAAWRRLFFDVAPVEIGAPGVACDHRAARRPDVIAGHGAVLVAVDPATARPRVRLWLAPDADADLAAPRLAEARAHLRDLAGADARLEEHTFLWCR